MQNDPTSAVIQPANIAADNAWSGALSVWATNKYVPSANGNVRVSGATVRSVRGAT